MAANGGLSSEVAHANTSEESPPSTANGGDESTAEVVIDVAEVTELEPDPQPDPELAEPEPPTASDEPAEHLVRLEETVEALPALARVAAELWLRAAEWGLGTSVRAGVRLARAATDPGTAAELYQDLTGGLRDYAREFLGISELDHQVRQLAPLGGTALGSNGSRDLRSQGAELLRQAADVDLDEGAHPAYARILTELAPDEARILRLLAVDGPQPLVDIRANNLIGIGSQLIAPGMNMIGAQAGVRQRDRVPAYLNNLGRLGLTSASDEAVGDSIAYQVLEAQPDVLGTIKQTPRAKAVHRSVELTPFGKDFCEVCFPLERPALPAGSDPHQP